MKPYSFKEPINSNTYIPKEIYDAILGGNKDWRSLVCNRLENSKSVANMLRLENIERTKQDDKNVKNMLCLANLECTKQGKSVENLFCLENLLRNKSIINLTQSQHLTNSNKYTSSNISITSKSYDKIDLPDPSETVIICDPPYRDTQGYQIEFDNDKFEQWCIDKAKQGYEVFVCEYNIANPAFEEVWSKEVINIGGGNKNQKRSIEKLYHVKK